MHKRPGAQYGVGVHCMLMGSRRASRVGEVCHEEDEGEGMAPVFVRTLGFILKCEGKSR